MENSYNKNSIESLDPREFTRLKPGVYCGNTEYSTQLLIEIISNSIDEFNLGHGSTIDIILSKDSVTVRDYGQGFLINELRDDGKTILEAAFSVLNTSGKYREDGTYSGTSLGAFGVGSKLCNFLSEWLEVTSYRNGKSEKIYFEDGLFIKRELNVNIKEPDGVLVKWKPDKQFFGNEEVNEKEIKSLLETLTCLCEGLTINLTDYNNKKITYYSKNGLNDYVNNHISSKELFSNRLGIDYDSGKNKFKCCLTYTNSYNTTIVPYINTGLTESGPHIVALKSCITREMNKFFRDKEWLKEKDSNFSGEDVQEGLYMIFNITTSGVTYDAQVKSRVVNIDMKEFSQEFVNQFRNWLEFNENDIKKIADKALQARKAREAAKKARDAIRNPKKKETGLKAKMALSDKFIDCSNKKPSERKLFILEGVSAGSAAIEARDPKTDCIYLLRGKIISPLKTKVDKILANQEMSDLINVIGAGFGDNFDINKMQFDKIIIMSDSDCDGDSISLLLTGFFFTYMRPLVEAGKLYRANTPLYTVIQNGKETYYYTDKEYQNWRQNAEGKFTILRAKGVGELQAEDLNRLCFNSENFKRFTISDLEKTQELLEIFLGKDVQPRKDYIYNNAKELGFNFD